MALVTGESGLAIKKKALPLNNKKVLCHFLSLHLYELSTKLTSLQPKDQHGCNWVVAEERRKQLIDK